MLSKDISDDQSKWKTYAWQILLRGITPKVRVTNRHLKTSSPCADDYLPESIIDDNLDDDVCHLEQTSENDKYEMKGGITLVKRQKPRIIRSVRLIKNKDPENYCREQIMFYTAWRNETTDLLKDFQTYQDRFEVVKDEIKQNRKQYENHTDVLDQAVQDIESEESGNIVAPNAQYRDEQDREIGSKLSDLVALIQEKISNMLSTT